LLTPDPNTKEMTGIHHPSWEQRNKKADDPSDRYAKMVPVAKRYAIIQFGLVLWHEVTAPNGEECIEASPYNFFVFPDNGPDISMSLSAMTFLRSNHLDFGKWITAGVPYANEKDEAYLRTKFSQEKKKEEEKVDDGDAAAAAGAAPVPAAAPQKIVLTKQQDIDFVARNTAKLEEFVADADATEFVFEKCNAYLRRVLYQVRADPARCKPPGPRLNAARAIVFVLGHCITDARGDASGTDSVEDRRRPHQGGEDGRGGPPRAPTGGGRGGLEEVRNGDGHAFTLQRPGRGQEAARGAQLLLRHPLHDELV